MFGQIRATSSSSLESLELERPPSKILKEDSLSIYETTLMKLKLGSQRNLTSPSNNEGLIDAGSVSSSTSLEPMKIDLNSSFASTSQDFPEFASSFNEEAMTMDTDHLSPSTYPSSTVSDSVSNPKQKDERIVSILYLFSKFKNTQNAVSSSQEDSVVVENGYSVSISPSLSSCQSLHSTEQQSEQEFVTS